MAKLSKVNAAVIALAFSLTFFFQNCAGPNDSNFDKINNSSSDNTATNPTNSQSTNESSNGLKIEVSASEISKTDCSLPGATFSVEISNADPDILMCQEYTLDMPKGHKRFGESYKCDGIDKFVKPPSPWKYDSNLRTWSKSTMINNANYVPGDYAVVIKDNSGIKKSNILKLRHYGFESCFNQTISQNPNPSTPIISCSWSGEDYSPSTPPTTSCTQDKSGKSETNINGVQYTCLCNQIKNEQTTPISAGGTGSGGGSSAPKACSMSSAFKVTSVDIGIMGSQAFPRTNFYPDANGIYSFRFKTPNSGQLITAMASAVPLVSATYSKLLVLSECPGDINISNKENSCWAYGADGSSVEYIVNAATSNKYKCSLKPNTPYYLNVAPISREGTRLCTSSKDCGFSFINR